MGLFTRKPGGILQSLHNIFCFQIRILVDDLPRCHSVSDKINNQRDRDTHPSNTCLTIHDCRIEGDPRKGLVCRCSFFHYAGLCHPPGAIDRCLFHFNSPCLGRYGYKQQRRASRPPSRQPARSYNQLLEMSSGITLDTNVKEYRPHALLRAESLSVCSPNSLFLTTPYIFGSAISTVLRPSASI